MSLLRFDPGTLIEQEKYTEAIDALAPRLEELRGELMRLRNPIEDSSASLATDDRCFFRLPEFQYAAYVARRESSDLGRVFHIANRLHDDIDSVIVLGEPVMSAGATALMRACCDPYHNEMTRASRGSKPRMYFEPNPLDNDAFASLLLRLRTPNAETRPETRWAIVSMHREGENNVSETVFDRLRDELGRSIRVDGESDLRRYVVTISPSSQTDNANHFQLPEGLRDTNTVLSPAGMLPAAMLGLDCMKLLEGAVVMNDHFRDTALDQNIVLRLAALNYLSAQRGRRHRVHSVWSESLASAGRWYDELVRAARGIDVETLTLVNPRDQQRFRSICQNADGGVVVHHQFVEQSRCDAIHDSEARSMDDLMKTRRHDVIGESVIPTSSLSLSRVDTFTLGQLFQLAMIATWVESRLGDSQ